MALFALAIQFVLAFGHAHPAQAQTPLSPAFSYVELIAAAIDAENNVAIASPQRPADDHDQPYHPLTDNCAVCAVMAMTASALFGASPILHLPEAVTLLYRATGAGFAHLDPTHQAFQPRAPPTS